MDAMRKTVFLIEDNDNLRSDLTGILQFAGYITNAFSDPVDFFNSFKPAVPAIVVSDMQMPNLSGVELQARMKDEGHQLPIIFISGESSDQQIVKAFKNGAADFLLKPFGREAFLQSVAKAMEQDIASMGVIIRQNQLAERIKLLAPREREVFHLLSKGCGNTEIQEALGISLHTTKQYKSSVMYKLHLRSLSELIALNAQLSLTVNALSD